MSSGRLRCGILATFLGKGDLRVPVTETLEKLKIPWQRPEQPWKTSHQGQLYVMNLKPDQVPIIRGVRTKYVSA